MASSAVKECRAMEIRVTLEGVYFKVKVQPRASKSEFAGLLDDALKVKLKAPPVDGAANKECIGFLAKCLGVPKSRVEISAGHASRNKTIKITYETDPPLKKEALALKQKIQELIN